jgi:hypothetical protein
MVLYLDRVRFRLYILNGGMALWGPPRRVGAESHTALISRVLLGYLARGPWKHLSQYDRYDRIQGPGPLTLFTSLTYPWHTLDRVRVSIRLCIRIHIKAGKATNLVAVLLLTGRLTVPFVSIRPNQGINRSTVRSSDSADGAVRAPPSLGYGSERMIVSRRGARWRLGERRKWIT